MFELSVKGDFAASHVLKGHKGKCRNLHGHTWKVEAVVVGHKLNAMGMVMDFSVLKERLKMILERVDHTHLNNVPPFDRVNPTTENLAKYIFDEFSKECRPLKIRKVTVWESENASITYHR